MRIRTATSVGLALVAVALVFASPAFANLITNGNFSSYTPLTVSGVAANGFELDTASHTATSLTGWTSAGYNFLFTPTTNNSGTTIAGIAHPGSYSPQYTNYLSLFDSSNGGVGNSWNGQGPVTAGYVNGPNFVGADGAYQVGALSQSVSGLIVGARYLLSFNWAAAQQTRFTGRTTEKWGVTLGTQSFSTAIVSNPSQGFTGWMLQTFTFTATANSEVLSFLAAGTPLGTPPFALLASVNLNMVPEPGSATLWLAGLLGLGFAKRRAAGKAIKSPA